MERSKSLCDESCLAMLDTSTRTCLGVRVHVTGNTVCICMPVLHTDSVQAPYRVRSTILHITQYCVRASYSVGKTVQQIRATMPASRYEHSVLCTCTNFPAKIPNGMRFQRNTPYSYSLLVLRKIRRLAAILPTIVRTRPNCSAVVHSTFFGVHAVRDEYNGACTVPQCLSGAQNTEK